ncbi:unnamed protein product, partial [Lymnaea stagnalis]
MDEDSDLDKELDNSLVDLNHGLDSSLDENSSVLDKEEDSSHQMACATEVMGTDQITLLQDMVVEMKKSFQSAVEELAKIQDKEEGQGNQHILQQQQLHQQEQLDNLQMSINEFKNQLSLLSRNVEEMKNEQTSIKDQLEEVRSNRGSSQDRRSQTGSDRANLLNTSPAPPDHPTLPESPEEWDTKLSEFPTEEDDQLAIATEVTAVACKSLSLTQALGEKCLKLNHLGSSEEEDDKPTNRRVSHYTPKTLQTALEEAANRRHSLPSSGVSRARNKDIALAAKRQTSVKELADSERDYCSKLWSLLNTYLTPLQTGGFFSTKELDVLLPSYMEQLYAEHYHIFTGLQERLVHWTHMSTIADLLAKVTDPHGADSLLPLYQECAEDLPTAVTCLKRALLQSAEFKNFLKAIQHSSCQSEELMSLIIAPVQHVPRLLLQLQQVIRFTPASHPDYPLLQTSLQRLTSFVEQLNKNVSTAMQTLSQENSLRLNLDQLLNARDGSVTSSTEESMSSARAFSKSDQRVVNSEWLDEPPFMGYQSYHHQPEHSLRHSRQLSTRHNALSQPDLTIINSFSSAPGHSAHMPRSQSTLPAEDGRKYRHYKLKKRQMSPGRTSSHDYLAHNNLPHNSPLVRPSSAIDFIGHLQQQQYSPRLVHREYNYPGPQPRPHSALGPHALLGPSAMEIQHRPTVISRKHLRRSQPQMSVGKSYRQDSSSSSVASRAGHVRGSFSAQDLMPSQMTTYPVMLDDADDEDDTRTSDTHSLASHPHSDTHSLASHARSGSHGSNEGPDIELDFLHSGFETHRQRSELHNGVQKSAEFSAADVTVSLARMLRVERNRNLENKTRPPGTGSPSLNIKATIQEHGPSSPEYNAQSVKPLSLGVEYSSTGGHLKDTSLSTDIDSSDFLDSLRSQSQSHQDDTHKSSSSTNGIGSLIKTFDGLPHNSKANSSPPIFHNNSNSDPSKISVNGDVGDKIDLQTKGNNKHAIDEQTSEKNRQFLLSLTSLSLGESTGSKDGCKPKTASEKGRGDNSAPSAKSLHLDSHRRAPEPPPRTTKTLIGLSDSKNVVNGSDAVKSPLGSPLPNQFSQLRQSNTSLNNISVLTPDTVKASQADRNTRALSLPSQQSPHYPFNNSSSPTSPGKTTYSTRANPFFNPPSSNNAADGEVSPIKRDHSHIGNEADLTSYPDSNELPPLDVDRAATPADERSRRREDGVKYPGGRKFDDPVSARKKMHFKASIKNLFSKKKGRVILADVEREVVMEMATAVATTTTSKGSSTTASFLTAVSGNKSGNGSGSWAATEGHSTDKGQEGQAFEIRTRKDQGSSTYSPIKVSKLFHRLKNTDLKPSPAEKNSHELNNEEFQQLRRAQESLPVKSSQQSSLIFGQGQHGLILAQKESSAKEGQGHCDGKEKIDLHVKNGFYLHPPAKSKQDERLTNENGTCKSEAKVSSGSSLNEGKYLEMNFSPLTKSFLKKSASENGKGLKKCVTNEPGHLDETSTLLVRKLDPFNGASAKRHSVGESVPVEHARKSLCLKCRACQESKSQGQCERDNYINTEPNHSKPHLMSCELNCCEQDLKLGMRAPQSECHHSGVLQNLDSENKIVVTEKVLHFSSDSLEMEDGLKPCGDAVPLGRAKRCDASTMDNAHSERKLNNSYYQQHERKSFSSPNSPSKQLKSPAQPSNATVNPDCPCTGVGQARLGENSFTSSDGSPSQDSKCSQVQSKVSESKISKTFHKLFPSSSPKKTEPKLQDNKKSPASPTSQSSNASSNLAAPQKVNSRIPHTSKAPKSLSSTGRDTIIKNGHPTEATSQVREKSRAKDFFIAQTKAGAEKPNVVEVDDASKQYVLEGKEFEHRYRLYYDDEAKTNNDGADTTLASSEKAVGGQGYFGVFYGDAEDNRQVTRPRTTAPASKNCSPDQWSLCYTKVGSGLHYLYQAAEDGQGLTNQEKHSQKCPEFTCYRDEVKSHDLGHDNVLLSSCNAAVLSHLPEIRPVYEPYYHGPDSRPSFAMSRPLQLTSAQRALTSSPGLHEDIRDKADGGFKRESSQGVQTIPIIIPDLASPDGQAQGSVGSVGHSTTVPSFVVDKKGAPCIPPDAKSASRASSDNVSNPYSARSNQGCARDPGEARGHVHKESRVGDGAAKLTSAPLMLPYAGAVYEESNSYKPKKLNVSAATEVKVIESHNLSTSRSVSTGTSSDLAAFRGDQRPQHHPLSVADKYDLSNNLLHPPSLCMTDSQKQYNFFKDNSRHQRPESYPNKSGDGRRSQGFFRASSPNNFFSNLQYRDYVIANRSSDSGTLVASESDCQITSHNPPNASVVRAERRGKNKVLVNIGKGR